MHLYDLQSTNVRSSRNKLGIHEDRYLLVSYANTHAHMLSVSCLFSALIIDQAPIPVARLSHSLPSESFPRFHSAAVAGTTGRSFELPASIGMSHATGRVSITAEQVTIQSENCTLAKYLKFSQFNLFTLRLDFGLDVHAARIA